MVICLERGADMHMSQLMPLPLTVSCFSKIQIGFTFLVPAHPGSPGQTAVKRVCVCVCVCALVEYCVFVSRTLWWTVMKLWCTYSTVDRRRDTVSNKPNWGNQLYSHKLQLQSKKKTKENERHDIQRVRCIRTMNDGIAKYTVSQKNKTPNSCP